MKKKVFIVILTALFIIYSIYLFFIAKKCEKVLYVYPEKGYCEFDLRTCEGFFGCKEYKKQQIPCGGEFTLCGEKGFCDCGE